MYEYNALTAKCRCMSADLFNGEMYAVLAGTPNLAEAARYLMNSASYAGVMRGTEPENIIRERLEALVEKSRFDAYEKLYKFTSGAARELVALLMGEIELTCLLRELLANFSAGNPDSSAGQIRAGIPKRILQNSKINFKTLLGARGDYGKIIEACAGSRYADIITRHLSDSAYSGYGYADSGGSVTGGNWAGIETDLMDRYYTDCARGAAAILDRANGGAVEEFIRAKADFMNAERIIRIKHFTLSSGNAEYELGQVLPELLTLHGRIGKSEASEMLKLQNTAQILDYCSDLYPRGETVFWRGVHTGADPVQSTGDYYSRFLYNYAIKHNHSNQAPLLSVVCYFALKRIETENIIYIIDATRYNISENDIMKNIII